MFTIWIHPVKLLYAMSKYGGLCIVAEVGTVARFQNGRLYGGARVYTFK